MSGREWRTELEAALPLLPLGGLLLTMAAVEGGYASTIRLPVTLVLLALVCVLVVAEPQRMLGPLGGSGLAIVLLAVFVAWLYVSMLWADDRAAAWSGANRGLLYLLIFALLARWGVTAAVGWVSLLAFGMATAVLGTITVVRVFVVDDPFGLFIGSRLSAPVGYPNGAAALMMIAAWPLAGLAMRRWLPVVLRATSLAAAVLLVDIGLLSQSRGSIYTMPVVAFAALLVTRERLRLLVGILVAAAAVAPAIRPVLDVYAPNDADQLRSDLRAAVAAIAISTVLAFAAGGVVALVDRRIVFGALARRTAWCILGAAALVAILVATATGSPVSSARTAWDDFRYSGEPVGTPTHFHGLGSNRYDFWRVGLVEFREHPVVGIGADNFAVPYMQDRRAGEEPLYPHSLPIGVLQQTGVVGGFLLLAFAAVSLGVALKAPGRRGEIARLALPGWFVLVFHSSVDWLWELPATGAAGIALLGLAVGLARPQERAGAGPNRLIAVPSTMLVALAAVSLLLPWLAARRLNEALATWRRDPAGAFASLDRARSLDPLSDHADVVAGAIASRLGRYGTMRDHYAQAVERFPGDWYAQLGLAVAAAQTRRPRLAAAAAARAVALNPRDPTVREVARRIALGKPPDPIAVDRAFSGGNHDRNG